VAGTRCSLCFILCHVVPRSNGFYACKNETNAVPWKHWFREKESWAWTPTLTLSQS